MKSPIDCSASEPATSATTGSGPLLLALASALIPVYFTYSGWNAAAYLAGEIKDFTGISAPYEEPEAPELVIDTNQTDIDDSARQVVDFLLANEVVQKA